MVNYTGRGRIKGRMTDERDEESGKFVKQYDDKLFFQAISSLETPTTQKIADEVGCSYDLAYRRLKELESEGEITSMDVGGSLLWKAN